MIKAKFKSNYLFSAYASYVKQPAPHVNSNHVQYYCNNCRQQFSANWDIKTNAMGYYLRGTYCVCPYCGKEHSSNIVYEDYGVPLPTAIELTVSEYKEKVVFTAKYRSFSFDEIIYKRSYEEGTESFVFTKDKAYYRKVVQYYDEKGRRAKKACTAEINQNTVGVVQMDSILFYLGKRCLCYKDKEFRSVKTALHNSMKKLFADKAATYLDTRGLRDGLFLRALFNYSYILNGNKQGIDRESKLNEKAPLAWLDIKDLSAVYANSILANKEKGCDDLTAIIKGVGLPDVKSIRRIVAKERSLVELLESFRKFKNLDYAIRYFNFISEYKGYYLQNIKALVSGLQDKQYTEQDIIALVEKYEEYKTEDCGRMYSQLNKEFQDLLKVKKVRARELHKWFVDTFNRQSELEEDRRRERNRGWRLEQRQSLEKQYSNEIDTPLKIPKHIKKRLVMQVLNSTFHLPENCKEMLMAGQELDNCIGSYYPKVRQKKELVVFISDDKGKLKAALCIIDNKIVEAEISGNRPVKRDIAINRAVVGWSKKVGIEIDTDSIDTNIEDNTYSMLAMTS